MNSHDTIDKFLSGSLSSEEMATFLEKVESDSELQQLLESDRIINSAIGKDKNTLMNHDLSGVAGSFVAGLAATSASASSALLTASYAKKAGFSWLTLTTSTILSVSLSAGAYWFINSSEKDMPTIQKKVSIHSIVNEEPVELTLTVPTIVIDKPAEVKILQKKSILPATLTKENRLVEQTTIIEEKPIKIRLEHSSSKYRPKNQE